MALRAGSVTVLSSNPAGAGWRSVPSAAGGCSPPVARVAPVSSTLRAVHSRIFMRIYVSRGIVHSDKGQQLREEQAFNQSRDTDGGDERGEWGAGGGIVTGLGRISGQECVIVANDATVKGGQ